MWGGGLFMIRMGRGDGAGVQWIVHCGNQELRMVKHIKYWTFYLYKNKNYF